jgi:hypothetical protein
VKELLICNGATQMMFKVGGKAGGFDLYRGFGEGNSAQFGFGDRIQVVILTQTRKNEREK